MRLEQRLIRAKLRADRRRSWLYWLGRFGLKALTTMAWDASRKQTAPEPALQTQSFLKSSLLADWASRVTLREMAPAERKAL